MIINSEQKGYKEVYYIGYSYVLYSFTRDLNKSIDPLPKANKNMNTQTDEPVCLVSLLVLVV